LTFRWRTFGITLACVSIVSTAAWLFWAPPYYLENDDVSIRMAFEGRIAPGAPPVGFALFPNAALGWLVVFAQRLIPSISWWDVVLASTLVLAIAVFVTLLWDALGDGWLARSTAIAAILVAVAPIIVSFQYTINATLTGGAAGLLAVTELRDDRPRRGVLAFVTLLFIVGILIRSMAAAAGAAVALVLCAPLTLTRGRWFVRTISGVAIVALCYTAAQRLDATLYGGSPEWNTYFRYNLLGGPLADWGTDVATEYGPEIQKAAGWTENDWLMLYRAFGVDPAIHGFDRVNRAYQTQMAIIDRVGFPSLIISRVKAYSPESVRSLLAGSAVLVVIASMLVAVWGTPRAIAQVAGMIAIFLAICFAIDVAFERLPWRLLAPLQIIFAGGIVLAIGASRRAAAPVLGIVALSAMVATTEPLLLAQAREARSRIVRSHDIDADVVALGRLSPSLVLFYGSRFPREYWWRPFHNTDTNVPGIVIGWNNQNPQVVRFLTATGREPLLVALCRDPSMFIVADRDPLDLVTTYMREHFNTAVTWNKVYDGSFPAWRCAAAGGRS
jgi:hypothetical protein